MMTPAQSERYSELDALRASMMLLGVVLHSGTAYCTIPDVWWLKDPATTRMMDGLVLWIHLFRLPVFFVMAGFFGAMLIGKRGVQAFIENRTARLFLPLLAGMFAIYPFLRSVSIYFWYEKNRGDGWAGLSEWYHSGKLANHIEPAHFWFLQILLFISLAAAPLARQMTRWLGKSWFRTALLSPAGPLIFSLPTFATLSLMSIGILDTPHDFTPPIRIFLAYAVFYVFGWGLWVHRDTLPRLCRGGWFYVVATMPMTLPILAALERKPAPKLMVAGINAIVAWLMVYGLLAVFLRMKNLQDPRWRYLSDSAYWIYLAHPIALVMIEIPLMHAPLHPLVKFVVGILFAIPVLLWTYDRWVRTTWVGVLLNGRSYQPYRATCSTASAARQAVSALRICGPSDTAVQPASEA